MRTITLLLTLVASLAFVGFANQQAVVESAFGPAAIFGTVLLGTVVLVLLVLTYLTRTRHRELVGNILLACASVMICYFVLDLAAGWILIGTLSPPLVPNLYRHHALVPDSQAEIRQRDFAYIQRVNHLGLRGRETTVEKPPGTRRIVMLGDSFTMGKGVEDDETFSVLVERALQASLAACGGGSVLTVEERIARFVRRTRGSGERNSGGRPAQCLIESQESHRTVVRAVVLAAEIRSI